MQKNSLKNKVAIITGSEGDIGKALCKRFRKEGAFVYGFDIKNGDDVTNILSMRKKIKTVADTHKKIDILINNAGITGRGLKEDVFHKSRSSLCSWLFSYTFYEKERRFYY